MGRGVSLFSCHKVRRINSYNVADSDAKVAGKNMVGYLGGRGCGDSIIHWWREHKSKRVLKCRGKDRTGRE